MENLESKLLQLIEELNELKKSDKPKPKQKVPAAPPKINPEDHPSSLSEDEAVKLVKEEVCKTLPNGQWVLE